MNERFVKLVELISLEADREVDAARGTRLGRRYHGTTPACVWEAMCVDPECLPFTEPEGLYGAAQAFVDWTRRPSPTAWDAMDFRGDEYPVEPPWLRFAREPWA